MSSPSTVALSISTINSPVVYLSVYYVRVDIVLPNAGKTDPGYYAYKWAGGQYLMQYKVIRLIEIDGETILKAKDPGLLTLTPLMQRSSRKVHLWNTI